MTESRQEQSMEALVAYVPVIHDGYMQMFKEYADKSMYVVDRDILDELPDLRKDIRALDPAELYVILESLKIFKSVTLLGQASVRHLTEENLVMPDDEVTDHLEEHYLQRKNIHRESIFLRWDRRSVHAHENVDADRTIEYSELDINLIEDLKQEMKESSDWWRRVGAVATTSGGQYFTAHNRHLPTAHTPDIDGDPRMHGNRGENREATTAIHAEAEIVSGAARSGISLENSRFYVTTFPCPSCAKLLSNSGVKTVYFFGGYAMVDGAKVLHDAGVELVQVTGIEMTNDEKSKPYPEKGS